MEVRVLSSALMIWTANLAYAVGLVATDGNLSKDGRHIIFVSKDLEQIENMCFSLSIKAKISLKKSGFTGKAKYFAIQFSNRTLYKFFLSVGLTPNKSKVIGNLNIPDEFFADFLRGCLDGDGFTYSYWDRRWKSSFMLYSGFVSASLTHLSWLRDTILRLYGCLGKVKKSGHSGYQLVFAKKNSIILLGKIYYNNSLPCLSRKKIKINKALEIISKQNMNHSL